MADNSSGNEIIIEVATPKNQNFIFGPLRGVRIRGRWDFHKIAGRFSHDSMKALNKVTSIIPGECLGVDVTSQRCRLFDPLRETTKGRALWEKLSPIIAGYQSHFECGTSLREPIVREQCNADTIKTWLYYMRRAVDSGCAMQFGNNSLPSLEDIKAMQGRRESGLFSNTQYATDEEREKARWKDVVPENSGRQTTRAKTNTT